MPNQGKTKVLIKGNGYAKLKAFVCVIIDSCTIGYFVHILIEYHFFRSLPCTAVLFVYSLGAFD